MKQKKSPKPSAARASARAEKEPQKQSTTNKILSGASVAAVLLVFGVLLWNRSASDRFDVVVEQRDELVSYVTQLEDASAYLTQQARFYAATSQQEYADSYWQEVNSAQNREQAVEALHAAGITDQEEALLDDLAAISDELATYEEQAMDLADRGNNTQAVELLLSGSYAQGNEQIQTDAAQITDSVKARMQARMDYLGTVIDLSFYTVFGCLLLVLLLQLLVIRYVLWRILNPVMAVKSTMVELAQGNLDVTLNAKEDQTEIGQLVHAVNDTKARTGRIIEDISYVLQELSEGNFSVDSHQEDSYIGAYQPILHSMQTLKRNQNQLISRIGAAALQVSTGSEQVSNSSQVLAQGATQQATSIEALSTAIGRISSDVTANAKLVSDATVLVENAGADIAEGNEKMHNMVDAMHEIGEKSDQIANIIKTIDDIAFQTNILALNAAVEAARAGTAGKGFAVVADEVRNLAAKSSQAAKDTADLIAGSTDAVHKGAVIADETARKLQEVAGNIMGIVSTIKDIEVASGQQSASAAQITAGIGEISSVVQDTQSMAEESANTSEVLSKQAQMLKDLVDKFQLME
jgi:methyl-accepting chemotaxis protein